MVNSLSTQAQTDRWLELSEAAQLLGVHFTTLRRWANDGRLPCYRMPGGQRRFKESELLAFLNSLRSGDAVLPVLAALPLAYATPHVGVAGEPWAGKFDASQRSALRSEGRQMMAVLMQYATRVNGGEVFLEEGRRMAGDYGRVCRSAGLSLVETAQAFVRVRRSIMDSVYQAGSLAGSPDAETWRLYDRMNHFLDSMLLATLEAYDAS
ncbi:MAG: helix-turn-helix domain-containing protein [Caldilineales bacterium]|nr:helix-turn-helix domain-containing protein [Caldilineales bacterium]